MKSKKNKSNTKPSHDELLEFRHKNHLKEERWQTGKTFQVFIHGNKGTKIFRDREFVLQTIKKLRHYLADLGTFHAITIGESQLHMVIKFHPGLHLIEWAANAALSEDTVTKKMKEMAENVKKGHEDFVARALISRSFQRFGISLGKSFNIRIDDHGHVVERRPKRSPLTTDEDIKTAILQTHRSADLTCERTMLSSAGIYGIGSTESRNLRYGIARHETDLIPPESGTAAPVEGTGEAMAKVELRDRKLEEPATEPGDEDQGSTGKAVKKIQLKDKWIGVSAVEHIQALVKPYAPKGERARKWHLQWWKASAHTHRILSEKIRQEKRTQRKLCRRQHCIPLSDVVEQVYAQALPKIPQMAAMAKIIVFCTLY